MKRRQVKWRKEAQLNRSNSLLLSLPRRRYLTKLSKLKEKRAKDFTMFIPTMISADEDQSKTSF